MRRTADVALPERHHLHQPARAHPADGILAERTFHFDQAEHHLGIQPRTHRFILDMGEQTAPFSLVGHITAKPGRHRREPTLSLLRAGEHQPCRIHIINRAAHHRSHVVGQSFLTLRTRNSPLRQQQSRAARQQQLATRNRMKMMCCFFHKS